MIALLHISKATGMPKNNLLYLQIIFSNKLFMRVSYLNAHEQLRNKQRPCVPGKRTLRPLFTGLKRLAIGTLAVVESQNEHSKQVFKYGT
jgi:hypothetical protein